MVGSPIKDERIESGVEAAQDAARRTGEGAQQLEDAAQANAAKASAHAQRGRDAAADTFARAESSAKRFGTQVRGAAGRAGSAALDAGRGAIDQVDPRRAPPAGQTRLPWYAAAAGAGLGYGGFVTAGHRLLQGTLPRTVPAWNAAALLPAVVGGIGTALASTEHRLLRPLGVASAGAALGAVLWQVGKGGVAPLAASIGVGLVVGGAGALLERIRQYAEDKVGSAEGEPQRAVAFWSVVLGTLGAVLLTRQGPAVAQPPAAAVVPQPVPVVPPAAVYLR